MTSKTPLLDAFLESGTLWIDEAGEVHGRAADGEILTFGVILHHTDKLAIESYLRAYPTPDLW